MIADRNLILERSESLEGLATYLQGIREQERAHLARELHDELGSLLVGAKLDVACLTSQLAGHSPEVDQHLKHLGDTLNRGIALKSSIVEGLFPSALTNLGLVAALEILAREFAASSGVRVETELQEVDLDAATQLAIYRLVQEALTNVGKYAAASRAEIVLRHRDSDTVVAVRDNGVGFDVARLRTSRHGLAGMRHRIEHCGGRLAVDSSTAEGTRIVAVLPPVCVPCSGRVPGPAHAPALQHH
jgi:signal transduction histidine kinase